MAEPKKILIVEDNFVLSMYEEKLLSDMGHLVVGKVPSGEEAVEQFQKLNPDLIIMDISLEGDMNGIEAMNIIREYSDVPAVFVSGNSDLFSKYCKFQKGFNEFVDKPFTSDDLAEPINRIFAEANIRRISHTGSSRA